MQILCDYMKKIFKHELISGASFIFIGSLLASFINFLINLFLTRNLSVSDYGTFASLVSLIMLAGLPAGAIVPMVVRFGASYFAKEELALVRGLFFKVFKASFLVGVCIFIAFLLFNQQVSRFLNIDDTFLIMLVGLAILLGFIGTVNTALLQAKLAFTFIAVINVISSSLKLFLGILLVYMGFGVSGAMIAFLFAFVAPYVLSFIPLRFIFDKSIAVSHIGFGKLLSYGAPSAIALFSLTSFITTDIILVKHFFDPVNAGIYATLSLVGRVIYFFSGPIGTVMFPLIVQKHAKEENFHAIFRLSLFLVLFPSLAITIFYFLFPTFTIQFFNKEEETLLAASYLGLFGIFITTYSLLAVVTNFYLSIKKTEIAVPLALGALLQAVLVWVYHESFLQIITLSFIITSLLLTLFLLYYWKLYGKKIAG